MSKPTKKTSGRPRTASPKKSRPSITIPPNVEERAKQTAEQMGISLSAFVEKAIRRELMIRYFGEDDSLPTVESPLSVCQDKPANLPNGKIA